MTTLTVQPITKAEPTAAVTATPTTFRKTWLLLAADLTAVATLLGYGVYTVAGVGEWHLHHWPVAVAVFAAWIVVRAGR